MGDNGTSTTIHQVVFVKAKDSPSSLIPAAWILQVSASPSPSAEREQVCPLFVDLASSLKGAKQKKKNKRGQFTSPYFKMGKQS